MQYELWKWRKQPIELDDIASRNIQLLSYKSIINLSVPPTPYLYQGVKNSLACTLLVIFITTTISKISSGSILFYLN